MQLRVLTFNTWGVPLFSRDRSARMRALARALAQMDVDVVGLQEVFTAADRQLLVEAAATGRFTYSHYFRSGLMGSGLLTLSKYPITQTSFLRFNLNGRPQDLLRSDYYAGKGIGRVRISTPMGPVDVYNAHFVAPYLEFGPDLFEAHRVSQAMEAGQYIATQSGGVPAILTCDLNCYPGDPTYQTILAAGGLVQACSDACEAKAGVQNGYATIHPPSRYDYVFARSGRFSRLVAQQTQIVLGGVPEYNPEGVLGYSDHYGVLTQFELASAGEVQAAGAPDAPGLRRAMSGSLRRGLLHNRKHRRKARLVAVAATASSAAILRRRRGGRLGPVGKALSALLAGLLLVGGVQLSTASRLTTESRTLAALLGEEK